MKRFILILISSFAVFFASAQEEIRLDSISKKLNVSDRERLMIDKPLIFGNSFSPDEIMQTDPLMFHQPFLPDYSKNFDFKKYLGVPNYSSQSFSAIGYGISPFYMNGVVFNQATYKINDRFSFGGNSFGARSIFDQPKLNSSVQDMSTKSASMFLQYKVSKSIKVETRISISNHQSPWEP
ncbi:MAG: hypothetical protein WC384_20625 [Prolixibacteraceae bacterium]|jgi:hypothetical protein